MNLKANLIKHKQSIIQNIEDNFEKGQPLIEGEIKHYKDGDYKVEGGKLRKIKQGEVKPEEKTKKPEEEVSKEGKPKEPVNIEKKPEQQENKPKTSGPILQKITNEVKTIIQSDKSAVEKLTLLTKMGFTDDEALIALIPSNRLSEIIQMKEANGIKNIVKPETQQAVLDKLEEEGFVRPMKAEEAWEAYKMNLEIVLDGNWRLSWAYGPGGVGKTFTTVQVLKEYKKEDGETLVEYDAELDPTPDEYDYRIYKAKMTPAALYTALYENNGKVVVFDDCDNVFEDPISVNMLKGVTDTSGHGRMTYPVSGKLKDNSGNEMPKEFTFTGKIIMISNMKKEKILKDRDLNALYTRSLPTNLEMTADETLAQLDRIKNKMPFEKADGSTFDVSTADRDAAFNFIKKYKDKIDLFKINARTMGAIALIKQKKEANPEKFKGFTWEQAALMTLTS